MQRHSIGLAARHLRQHTISSLAHAQYQADSKPPSEPCDFLIQTMHAFVLGCGGLKGPAQLMFNRHRAQSQAYIACLHKLTSRSAVALAFAAGLPA